MGLPPMTKRVTACGPSLTVGSSEAAAAGGSAAGAPSASTLTPAARAAACCRKSRRLAPAAAGGVEGEGFIGGTPWGKPVERDAAHHTPGTPARHGKVGPVPYRLKPGLQLPPRPPGRQDACPTDPKPANERPGPVLYRVS